MSRLYDNAGEVFPRIAVSLSFSLFLLPRYYESIKVPTVPVVLFCAAKLYLFLEHFLLIIIGI